MSRASSVSMPGVCAEQQQHRTQSGKVALGVLLPSPLSLIC